MSKTLSSNLHERIAQTTHQQIMMLTYQPLPSDAFNKREQAEESRFIRQKEMER